MDSTRWRPAGACVFVRHEVIWCVTAAHIIRKAQTLGVGCVVGVGESQTAMNLTDIYRRTPGLDWVIDSKTDIAVAPMPVAPGIQIRAIDFQDCLEQRDVLPSMPCLTAGQPYGIPGVVEGRATPIILSGVIAGMDPENRRIFISVPTFPGNSGGPIIVQPEPYTATGTLNVGRPTVLLAGVVTETVMVADDQPRPQRIPALHLGAGASFDAIKALIQSTDAQRMLTLVQATPASR